MTAENNTPVGVVPWCNAAQFQKVHEYLYSAEITKKRWAIDTISIWETRCHPSLPTAIEATYVLTSAVIQDILWTNKTTLIHHIDLQGIYGSAVARFVSLSVEVNKNKGNSDFSNSKVATSIGIPSFIVDIRNEWCHSSRSSLSLLRLATQSALKYLKETYWEKEAARVNNYVRQPLDDTELHSLFKDFIKFHEDTLNSTKVIKSDDGTLQVNPEYTMLLKNLGKYLNKHKRLFIKVLISDGIFVPTDEDLKRTVSKEDYTLFNVDYFLDDDDDDDDSETQKEMDICDIMKLYQFEAKNMPELPDYYQCLWEPIISLLNKYDAVPLFMEALLKSQANRTTVGQKFIISWILVILRIHSATIFSVKAPKLKRIFRSKGIVSNWLSMLHSAISNPCKYALYVLPLILRKLNLKQEIEHRIIGMTALKLGLASVQHQRKNYCKLFHTAKNLKEALDIQRGIGKEQSTENIWSPCPDDCHKSWPIGHIVNAVKDDNDYQEVEMEDIFECSLKALQTDFAGRVFPSNKNEEEDDDDDQTYKLNEEPDLSKIMLEIENKDTILYKRSG